MYELEGIVAEQLLRWKPLYLQAFVGDIGIVEIAVHFPDVAAGRFVDMAKPFIAFPQCRLNGVLIADVLKNQNDADDPAILIPDRCRAVGDLEFRAGSGNQCGIVG